MLRLALLCADETLELKRASSYTDRAFDALFYKEVRKGFE
jgi:hypothetical protein